VTQSFFLERYTNYFRPTALCVCQQNEITSEDSSSFAQFPGHPAIHSEVKQLWMSVLFKRHQTPLDVSVV